MYDVLLAAFPVLVAIAGVGGFAVGRYAERNAARTRKNIAELCRFYDYEKDELFKRDRVTPKRGRYAVPVVKG